jgi:GTPase SAR1 family protein
MARPNDIKMPVPGSLVMPSNISRFEQSVEPGVLDLSGLLEVEYVPQEVWDEAWKREDPSGIHTLNLSDNYLDSLTSVPLDRLTELKTLVLDRNRFHAFPEGLNACASLEHLSLDGNGIISLQIPEVHLPKLSTLRVSRNGLEVVHPSISRLKNLKYLDLSQNLLRLLPDTLSDLHNLRELVVGGNPDFLPPESITSLRSLRHLDMSYNGLVDLPSEFGNLSPEITLRLDGNFFDESIEILATHDTPLLLAHLRSLETEPHYEAKLVLVGEGNVGKTSLVEALRGGSFIEDRLTTHGIEIKTLTAIVKRPIQDVEEVPAEQPEPEIEITIRSWDFGGQEIYRITNQFFFTKGALYLVVWRPREGQEANFIERWLKRIRIRCGQEARVLLVSTHADEGRSPEIDYPDLRRRYGDILVGNVSVDSKSGRGIPQLREKLGEIAANLPRMGERISRRWVGAQDELLALNSPYVKRASFDRICERTKVDDVEAEALASLLNDIGYIVYYPDDEELRDILILQPEWLTKAISHVLEDTETRENQGILSHASLARIWAQYDEKLHPYFLRLMEKFDVSYRTLEEDASLVAQLVPYTKPEAAWPDDVPVLSFFCDFDYEPVGIIPWMTVRTRRFSAKQWRNGFTLEHPEYDAKAIVEKVSETRISVKSAGGSGYFLFAILRDTLQQLIKIRWPGLPYRVRVQCLGASDIGAQCDGSFPIENLEKLRSEGDSTIRCPECLTDNDVNELLVGFPAPRKLLQEFEDIRELKGDVARIGQALRAMLLYLKAADAEVKDCPRLFTIGRLESKPFDPRQIWKERFTLQLWCEEPGNQHSVGEPYTLGASKEWVADIAPYLRFTAKVVTALAPITGNVGGLIDAEKLRESSLLMKSLADVAAPLQVSGFSEEANGQLSQLEGAALRRFREVLFNLDSSRDFRGLRRAYSPAGQYLWLCDSHYHAYEPPLPQLPHAPMNVIEGSVEES